LKQGKEGAEINYFLFGTLRQSEFPFIQFIEKKVFEMIKKFVNFVLRTDDIFYRKNLKICYCSKLDRYKDEKKLKD
jgi:hypothetical protein